MERFEKKKKTSTLILKIESDLKDSLKGWAEAENVTMSEYIRTLLLEEAKRRTNEKN